MEELNKPLQASEIEWRVQSQTKDGKRILVVPYVNNRTVMERFDKTFGWGNWSNAIQPIDGGFLCTITVRLHDGQTVSKTDGASRTGIEPIKGGISDSMKRCAVQFGLGRSLYDYPKIFIETTDKYIPNWAEGLLSRMVDKMNSGGIATAVVVLKPEHAKK